MQAGQTKEEVKQQKRMEVMRKLRGQSVGWTHKAVGGFANCWRLIVQSVVPPKMRHYLRCSSGMVGGRKEEAEG